LFSLVLLLVLVLVLLLLLLLLLRLLLMLLLLRLSMDAHRQLKVRQLASLCSQAGCDITTGKFCIEDAHRY
jgi:hypothetical protein